MRFKKIFELILRIKKGDYLKIKIRRTEETYNYTLGELEYMGFECKTLELGWQGNQKNISCIPKGEYEYSVLLRSKSFNYPHVWIKNVRNRSGIKIHRANFVSELRGCIAVGMNFKDIDQDGTIDVTDSTDTLRELIKVIPLTGKIVIE